MPLVKAVNIPGIPTEVIFDPTTSDGSLSEDVLNFFKEDVIPQVIDTFDASEILSDFDTTYLENASEKGSDANIFFVDNNLTLSKNFNPAAIEGKISDITSKLEDEGSFIDNFEGSKNLARAKVSSIKNVVSKLQDFAIKNTDQRRFIENEIIDSIYTNHHAKGQLYKNLVSVGIIIQGMLDEEGNTIDDILYMMPLFLPKDDDYLQKNEKGQFIKNQEGTYTLTDKGKKSILKDLINPTDSKIYARYSTDNEKDTNDTFRSMNRELSSLLDIVEKQRKKGANISYRIANAPSINDLSKLRFNKRPVKSSEGREKRAESNETYKEINNGTFESENGNSISNTYNSISKLAKSIKDYDNLEGYLKKLSSIYDEEEGEDAIGNNLDNVEIPIDKIYDLVRWHISDKNPKDLNTLYSNLESEYKKNNNDKNIPSFLVDRGMQSFANGILNDQEKEDVKYIDSSLFNFLDRGDGERLKTYFESDSVGNIFTTKPFILEHVYPLNYISVLVWRYFIESKEEGKSEEDIKEGLEYIIKTLYKEAFISSGKDEGLRGKKSKEVRLSQNDISRIYNLDADDSIQWKRYNDSGLPPQPKYYDMIERIPPGSRVDGITYGDIYVPDSKKIKNMNESITNLLFNNY